MFFAIFILINVCGNVNDFFIPDEQPDFKAIFEERPSRKRASSSYKKQESTWVWGEDK